MAREPDGNDSAHSVQRNLPCDRSSFPRLLEARAAGEARSCARRRARGPDRTPRYRSVPRRRAAPGAGLARQRTARRRYDRRGTRRRRGVRSTSCDQQNEQNRDDQNSSHTFSFWSIDVYAIEYVPNKCVILPVRNCDSPKSTGVVCDCEGYIIGACVTTSYCFFLR